MKRHESGQRFPLTVKVGSASVKIYRGKSRGYDLFTLVYYEHGERKRETFGKLENAKTRATDVATQIARGRAGLLTLSNADRESYLAAANLLSSLGIPLHAAVEEYVTARSYLIGESLVEVASKHAKRNGNVTDKRVAELVEELLVVKEADGASIRYRQSLRSHLRRFAAAFKTNIGSVTAPAIDAWLRSTGGGLRTRRNLRMSVITLFHFARDRGHLPKGDTEADQVKRPKERGGRIGFFKPAALAQLLSAAEGEIALYVALGAFTGIRSAELLRLDWSDINFDRQHITVGADKAKTATRRLVPIAPNLRNWLAPYRGSSGRVFRSEKAAARAIAFAKKLGFAWPNNVLRHSYATHRLALTADAARVALEMGTSPAMLFSNYRELADEHEAKAWFAISPRRPRNVVALRAG